jgi:uncharacterized protein YkwD
MRERTGLGARCRRRGACGLLIVALTSLPALAEAATTGPPPAVTVRLSGGGAAATRLVAPTTATALRARLVTLDARFGALARRGPASCATPARADARSLRTRALRGARRADAASLRTRIRLISRALVGLGATVQRCAAAASSPSPAAPAPAVASAPAAPITATVPISLESVVNGEPLDLTEALGPLVLPPALTPLDLGALAGPACLAPGAICLGLDRALLDASLHDVVNRNVIELGLENLVSLNLGGLLNQVASLLGAGDLDVNVGVERAGDREIVLGLLGPLGELTGAADVPDVIVGRLQAVVPIVVPPPIPTPPAAAPAGPIGQAALGNRLLAAMNRARVSRRRARLTRSARLERPAQAQSARLSALGRLAHDGPAGVAFSTRLVAAGLSPAQTLGENLAMVPGCDPRGAQETVRRWLASPRHRANLLSSGFELAGTGAASSPGCIATIYTADFAGRARPPRAAARR